MNAERRQAITRLLAVVTAILGINYVVWRWACSVRWSNWWIAVPLVLAETYSLIDTLLFALTTWRLRERVEAPPAPKGCDVDVFITTYDEPVDLVMRTARAAQAITYPHKTWLLDDGDRVELRAEAEAQGIGWLTRSHDWHGHERHAKAGNLNNALLQTDGEFVLVLDADQVPEAHILDRTLGYFNDPEMAFVQTPQYFSNVPESDPLGSQAPLFYGPIQQGKDGWNAAFFCGSNAVLRREALMELGVKDYVRSVDHSEDLERSSEALPVMPVATISVTEDMATAMRLHSMGWNSVYHHESLALGLAPEDIRTMLTQRLRWAQGTMQVMFRQNPLVQRGLSWAQRLMYFATMWSYLSGFAAVVYLIAPVLYLTLGVLPVKAYGLALFARLIPFLIASQAMFLTAGQRCRTWRGQQYSLALFPIWIKSVTSAFNSVYRGKELPFAVTPKVPQGKHKPHWAAVRWQLAIGALLIASVPVGLVRLFQGDSSLVPTCVNLVWVAYDLLVLSVIVPAARYQGYDYKEAEVPCF